LILLPQLLAQAVEGVGRQVGRVLQILGDHSLKSFDLFKPPAIQYGMQERIMYRSTMPSQLALTEQKPYISSGILAGCDLRPPAQIF